MIFPTETANVDSRYGSLGKIQLKAVYGKRAGKIICWLD